MSKQTPPPAMPTPHKTPAMNNHTMVLYGMADANGVVLQSLHPTRKGANDYRRGASPARGKLPVVTVTLSYELPPAPRPARKD